MKNLSKFISVLELTREQPQYGYFLVGLNKHNTSNLAEHHYLVAMLGWMLCEYINETETLINTTEVMQLCMMHDLGEIFGGDMAGPLSRKRPDLKVHAQAFERGNFEMLLSLLSPRIAGRLQTLWKTQEARVSDESVIAKIADLMECHFFLEHRSITNAQKDAFYTNHIKTLSQRISHPVIKARIEAFFEDFELSVKDKGFKASEWIVSES